MTCFGEFTIMHDSVNILHSFTSQEREFAALLFVYSLVLPYYHSTNKAGINPGMMIETMWPDVSNRNLRNRYGVILNKISEKFKPVKWISIHRISGMHVMAFDPAVPFDFHQFIILKDIRMKSDVIVGEILDIVSNGSFLTQLSTRWLDDIQIRVNLDTVDLLASFLELDTLSENMKERCSKTLLYLDTLNFDAAMFQIRQYKSRFRYSQAKILYDKFNNLYLDNFNEKFPVEFEKI